MEQLIILMRRHLNCIREILNLTRELEESLQRNDQASALLILRQRAEQMAKADRCTEELRTLAAQSPEMDLAVNRLFANPPVPPGPQAGEDERNAYGIRLSARRLMEEIRRQDERMSRRMAGRKSFYQ